VCLIGPPSAAEEADAVAQQQERHWTSSASIPARVEARAAAATR